MAWKFGDRIRRVIRVVDGLHDRFGQDPVEELHDITQSLRTTATELELRARIVEAHLPIGVFVADEAGRFVWGNDPLCASFGIDSRAITGFGWVSAIEEVSRQAVLDQWKRVVQDGTSYEAEYTVVPKDGADPWRARAGAWRIKHRGFVGYVCQVDDE